MADSTYPIFESAIYDLRLDTTFRWDAKRDRDWIVWILKQFIAGEMTGLLEGKAILYAPDLEAADFLASQVRDEIKHARIYKKHLDRYKSGASHAYKIPWLLKKLIAPVSGRLWEEHCLIDKAIGELWVYSLMQWLIVTSDDERLRSSMRNIAKDEIRHIQFGRTEVLKAIKREPGLQNYFLGLYLLNRMGLRLLRVIIEKLARFKKRKDIAELMGLFFQQTDADIQAITFELLSHSASMPNLFYMAYAVWRRIWRGIFYRRFRGGISLY